ncbi:hypothetical protein C7435_1391 [Maricaulis maris]|uniref:DUF3325 domain-containing protein n=2 Tax=Maricaulis maris TaxID=74318 RepID=A0A495DD01_9PROT|nr:hypothetical protein C7435_1391 [Maricaulis maris]
MAYAAAIWILLSIGAGLFGALVLRQAWKRRQEPHRLLIALGWLALLAAVLAWLPVGLPVYGVVLGMLVIQCLALMVVFWRTGWTGPPPAEPRRPAAPQPARAWRRGLRGTAVTLLAGPLALLGAVALSLILFALAGQAGWSEANRLALFLFAVPILWSALATLAVLDLKLRLRALGLVLPVVLGGVLIAVTV